MLALVGAGFAATRMVRMSRPLYAREVKARTGLAWKSSPIGPFPRGRDLSTQARVIRRTHGSGLGGPE